MAPESPPAAQQRSHAATCTRCHGSTGPAPWQLPATHPPPVGWRMRLDLIGHAYTVAYASVFSCGAAACCNGHAFCEYSACGAQCGIAFTYFSIGSIGYAYADVYAYAFG